MRGRGDAYGCICLEHGEDRIGKAHALQGLEGLANSFSFGLILVHIFRDEKVAKTEKEGRHAVNNQENECSESMCPGRGQRFFHVGPDTHQLAIHSCGPKSSSGLTNKCEKGVSTQRYKERKIDRMDSDTYAN